MKKSTWRLRVAIMSAFLLVTNLLVIVSFLRAFSIERRPLFILCYTVAICILIGCFGRIRSGAPYLIKCIGAYGMGLYVTLTMVSALCFFLPLPGWVTPALAAVLALYGFLHARSIGIKHYAVPLLDKPFRLVLISDVHLGAVGSEERLPLLIDRINEQQPDLVCIAGDLVDNFFPAIRNGARAAALLRSIRSRCGVYACLGNHDAGESTGEMQRFMAEAGVRVLKEEYAALAELQLLGRLDERPHGGYDGEERQDTKSLLDKNENPALPLVVMDHNPSAIPQYDSRVSLLLCGHTHNGQIFPGSLVIKAINICGYGHYRRDDHSPHVVVSSGAGTWGMPLRIGTDCEIAVIELGQ